jgi:hypothetical protein
MSREKETKLRAVAVKGKDEIGGEIPKLALNDDE